LWSLTFKGICGSYPQRVQMSTNELFERRRSTFGVDQFSLGTTEPLSRAISRVKRAVKSARGSSFSSSTSDFSVTSVSPSISSISDIKLVVSLDISIVS